MAAPESGPRARKTSTAGRRRRIGAGLGRSQAKGKARARPFEAEPGATEAERRPTTAFSVGSRRIGQKRRSEEHTSELQSLMRSSYAVFCLKKKTKKNT